MKTEILYFESLFFIILVFRGGMYARAEKLCVCKQKPNTSFICQSVKTYFMIIYVLDVVLSFRNTEANEAPSRF